jgi:hypothetical protein
MPVLKFANGRKQYVQRRKSDGAILKRNVAYPTTEDGGPIQGLDPDLEFLEMWTDLRPEADPLMWVVTTRENVEVVLEEGAPEELVFHTTWASDKRPADDIKHAVVNIESLRNKDQVPDSRQLKVLMSVVRIIVKRMNNQTLNQKEAAAFAEFHDMADAMAANEARVAALFVSIENGETPDIHAGWAAKPQ